MTCQRFKLIFFAPHESVEACKNAIFTTSAGTFPPNSSKPLYTHCAFSTSGTGQFQPTPASNPSIGSSNTLSTEPETRVEITCPSADVTKEAITKLKQAHPYEVPVYEVYRIEDF